MHLYSQSVPNSPLALIDLQNISAIMVPDSLMLYGNGTISVDMYYLIHYQEIEAVIEANTALNIAQVNISNLLHHYDVIATVCIL